MSSGVEADIALDAAVVLSLGMGRAAGKAAGLTAAGAQALAALAQGRAEARAAALAEAGRQDRAIRDVIDRTARIGVLADALREAGLAAPLPAPLPPGEHPAEEMAAWCRDADRLLDQADEHLREHLAATATATIFDFPAPSLRADLDPAVRDRDAPHALTLVRVLARLAPDTAAQERDHVLEAAARLPRAATDDDAEALLSEVRLRVQHANERTRERRAAERRAAAEREAREQAEAEQRYVLDTVTRAFEDLGYEVDAGFETMTASDGELTLTRGEWPDHSVRMRVEDAGAIRAAMVRTSPPRSEDDRRRDAEREREWCAAFETARERLAAAGVNAAVTWRVEPGDQELPVVASARHTRSRTPMAKQREREI